MTAQYVNTILNSVKTVFISMLDMAVTFNNPISKTKRHPTYNVCSVIKTSGDQNHWIVLSFSTDVALALANQLLNESFTEINEDVMDAVGEITNMVVGVTDTALEMADISYSLPMVAVQKDSITYPDNGFIISMPCFAGPGQFEVDITMCQEPV